jgi:hypothetical protein
MTTVRVEGQRKRKVVVSISNKRVKVRRRGGKGERVQEVNREELEKGGRQGKATS